MKFPTLLLWIFLLPILIGCQERTKNPVENLSHLKDNFIKEALEGAIEEEPFYFAYKLQTTFVSEYLVSFLGEFQQYTHLPHGWNRFEGRTYIKENGNFRLLTLNDLFLSEKLRSYIPSRCNLLLANSTNNTSQLAKILTRDFADIVVNHENLILIFQPYTIEGFADQPTTVQFQWTELYQIAPESICWNFLRIEKLSSKLGL